MKEFFKGKKTYILSSLAFLMILVPVLSGDVSLIEFLKSPDAVNLIYSLMPASFRAALAKS